MAPGTVVSFVSRSRVRSDVLRALAADPRPGDALVSDLSVSKSGVYKALDELSDRDLVFQSGGAWQLAGAGRLVVDELERHRWLEALVSDREYWLTHDVSGLPDRFRRRLPHLRNVDLLRNPENHPHYLEEYWVERMPDADRLWAGTRVVSRPYADATIEQAGSDVETRLLVHGPLLEQFLERTAAKAGEFVESRPDAVDERVCHLPCSFMLTDELFTLSLPLHDGQYDPDSVLVGRDDAALRFGRDFFAHYWERATPVASYLGE